MTGWTWDYVNDTLTFERLDALRREWDRNPPLTLMAKAYLGIKTPTAADKEWKPPEELPEFED
jgi:hypothetical protein